METNKESYRAKDIALYIINYSNKIRYGVTNLKLQKLLYYVQAYFIVEKGVSCFNDDIEYWRHGPVIIEVYNKYKSYYTEDILYKDWKTNISDEDKYIICSIVDSYKRYDGWAMVNKTKEECSFMNISNTISIKNIKDYFNVNKDDIFG